MQVPANELEHALLAGTPQVVLVTKTLPELRHALPGDVNTLAMAYFNRAVEQVLMY